MGKNNNFGLAKEDVLFNAELALKPGIFPQSFYYKSLGNVYKAKLGQNYVAIVKKYFDQTSCAEVIDNNNVNDVPQIIPISNFKGIVAVGVEKAKKSFVTLVLWGIDNKVTIPLYCSRDMKEILLNWRLWANVYNLPMFVVKYKKLVKVHENTDINIRQLKLYAQSNVVYLRMVSNTGLCKLVISNHHVLM